VKVAASNFLLLIIRSFSVCYLLLAGFAFASPANRPIVTVVPTSNPAITLDGRLNEPAWQDAPEMKLTQQAPKPGAPTSYETVVHVIVTSDHIYFGFLCKDPDPHRIAIHTMRRDGEMEGDDTVSIVLDTYGDGRTGYFFQINAAGARVDGLISKSESASLDWDGIWDARTAQSSEGWSAEIVIPTRTLSFTPGLNDWGLNVERFIPRERTWLRWASPQLDSFLYDLSRAGRFSGLAGLEQGKGLEISPYAAGKTTRYYGSNPRAWQGAAGGDVTWKITPELVTVFTLNTDFAETEVDTRQINLTRFPLFFPEKRSFFLEGANQYVFGLNLQEQFIPFFSRNIGLLDGAQIPLDGGIKLNGRVGRWNLALLDVQTRDTIVPEQVAKDLALPSSLVRGTNLFTSRISYDVNNELRIGTILTHGDPEARRDNTLAGFDAVWRTSKFRGNKNLQFGAWTATTQGDVGPGSKLGWGFNADYPNDLLDCAASVNQFGAALEPLLGFLPRPGTRRTSAFCAYQPRPSKNGPFRWIRQEFFENEYVRYTDPNGILESWEYFMAPINVRLESGDRFEFNWNPHGEILLAPFEIARGVIIPPGSYQFTQFRVEGQTSPHRPLQFGSTTWFGSFFDGHLTQWQNFVRWTSSTGRLQLEANAENDFGYLPQANFVQRLWQLQGTYAWTPNLLLSSFIQYDTESQNIGANTRLRWTIKPGNDLFIVWNRGWQRIVLDPHETSIVPQSDVIAVKLRWTFRR
jgi:hypothetical protein